MEKLPGRSPGFVGLLKPLTSMTKELGNKRC